MSKYIGIRLNLAAQLQKISSYVRVPREKVWAKWPHWELAAYLLLIAVALGMRLWSLGEQAIHHDESLHALYSWYISEGGEYVHNPLMHGPFQFSGISFFYLIFGASDSSTRLLSVLFGVVLVVLPILLRSRLGRAGALITSFMLTFSPTMLYFSRFARNDILMAVWALALVAFMWRYFETKKSRYLLYSSMTLAFAYSTKETAFLLVAVLGSYLLIRASSDVLPWFIGRKNLSRFSPEGDYLILIGTLTLPLLAASVSILQGPLGLTLANADPNLAAVGVPIGTGQYLAFMVTGAFLVLSSVFGLLWRPRIWVICFSAAIVVWVSLHINVPAFWYGLLQVDIDLDTLNLGGFTTGIWQSLGYWIQQHEVCRGCQPWYYYFVIGLNYEFLPMVIAVPAMFVYIRRGDAFSRFLVYWAISSFILYSFAGEKMPWLLVEVALPFIVLAGKFLGECLLRSLSTYDQIPSLSKVVESAETELQETVATDAAALKQQKLVVATLVSSLGLLLFASAHTLSRALDTGFSFSSSSNLARMIFILIICSAVAYFIMVTQPYRRAAALNLGLALAMLSLSLMGAFRLAYINSDVPVEMLVYTQTSPDIPMLMDDIERLGQTTGRGKDLRITVDGTDGFSWPWAWYLRDYPLASYPCLSNEGGCTELTSPPEADVVLLALRNRQLASQHLSGFQELTQYKHRWWFPEGYRDLSGLGEKDLWNRIVGYFLFRDFPTDQLGSIDGMAYFPEDFETTNTYL